MDAIPKLNADLLPIIGYFTCSLSIYASCFSKVTCGTCILKFKHDLPTLLLECQHHNTNMLWCWRYGVDLKFTFWCMCKSQIHWFSLTKQGGEEAVWHPQKWKLEPFSGVYFGATCVMVLTYNKNTQGGWAFATHFVKLWRTAGLPVLLSRQWQWWGEILTKTFWCCCNNSRCYSMELSSLWCWLWIHGHTFPSIFCMCISRLTISVSLCL